MIYATILLQIFQFFHLFAIFMLRAFDAMHFQLFRFLRFNIRHYAELPLFRLILSPFRHKISISRQPAAIAPASQPAAAYRLRCMPRHAGYATPAAITLML